MLMKAIASTPEVILHFLQRHVFPKVGSKGSTFATAFLKYNGYVTQVMHHQEQKLQASGVDLGGDTLFGVRLGFSGTPSDLLPRALRPCHYEPGSGGFCMLRRS